MPLFLQDDFGISLGVFGRFDFGNGKSGLCEIDTGKQGITIDKHLAPSLGVNLDDPSLKRVQTPTGSSITATIPSLTLIGATDSGMKRPTVQFADLVYDCDIGNAYWADRWFTLDIPERLIYVQVAPE